MRTSTSSYIVELPLRVNDQQNRFLEMAFEFKSGINKRSSYFVTLKHCHYIRNN